MTDSTTRSKGGGQPGNKNARKAKDWENALRRQLAQYEGPGVAVGSALNAIAKKCIEQAISGCKDARAEIANRLDGKAREHVEVDYTRRLAEELSDDELLSIARGGSDGAADAPGGPQEPPELH